ncbi:hypothetical protein [Paractinoplanes durhamensis]|uniref:Uncharacterized protein n=1 Tax=Paractinoplanes durhamensis TaxID=113563 RepID=A0ABQ3YS68_9ACTN|nr:hypothetical protein [Actinoplanes durhamensis]GIE00423.1 hypothetical protein Adu01nite_17730 [Actinoplanes durhamensis]
MRAPESVEVGVDLKFISVKGTWKPSVAEREAAWELYVELITRVSVVPLQGGILREALSSYYTLFAGSRDVLRKYGPQVAEPKPDGQYSFGFLTVAMLNRALRPVLSYWHPELSAWEATRAEGASPVEHERAWEHEPLLRQDLEAARKILAEYAKLLGAACGVPDLSAAVPGLAAS